MKHKFLALILVLAATLCLCFGLVACDKTGGGQTAGGGQTNETAGDETEKDTDGDETEKDTEEKGIAGKTFVFYDITCEGMDEALLEQYRVNNRDLEYAFAADGTATSTATVQEMTIETHLTYTVSGNEVTLTTVSMTINGEAQEVPDPAPTAKGTYDGTAFTCVSTTQDNLTLVITLHEKAAE